MSTLKTILTVIAVIVAGCITIPLWIGARFCEGYLAIERPIQSKIANIMARIANWSKIGGLS